MEFVVIRRFDNTRTSRRQRAMKWHAGSFARSSRGTAVCRDPVRDVIFRGTVLTHVGHRRHSGHCPSCRDLGRSRGSTSRGTPERWSDSVPWSVWRKGAARLASIGTTGTGRRTSVPVSNRGLRSARGGPRGGGGAGHAGRLHDGGVGAREGARADLYGVRVGLPPLRHLHVHGAGGAVREPAQPVHHPARAAPVASVRAAVDLPHPRHAEPLFDPRHAGALSATSPRTRFCRSTTR